MGECAYTVIFSGQIRMLWYDNFLEYKVKSLYNDSSPGISFVYYLTDINENCDVDPGAWQPNHQKREISTILRRIYTIGEITRSLALGDCPIIATYYCLQNSGMIKERSIVKRIQSQWLALGLGFNSAKSLSVIPKAYLRLRTDTCDVKPLSLDVRNVIQNESVPMVIVNLFRDFGVNHATGQHDLFLSDRFAALNVKGAEAYFKTWKVWQKINEGEILQMGSVENSVCHNRSWGECPLSAWMQRFPFELWRHMSSGDPIWRPLNSTHVFMQHNENKRVSPKIAVKNCLALPYKNVSFKGGSS